MDEAALEVEIRRVRDSAMLEFSHAAGQYGADLETVADALGDNLGALWRTVIQLAAEIDTLNRRLAG